MKNIIEVLIDEMNAFLEDKNINGCCIWNKEAGEILLNVEDILLSQLNAFESRFNILLSSQLPGYNGFCFDITIDDMLKGRIFQTEITQEDCKGNGIKVYRKNDATFPAKSHPNTYLGVFETNRQVYECIDTYTHLLLLGKHEDLVFNIMKHEEVKNIKNEF